MPIQALPTKPVGAYWPNFGAATTRLVDYPNIVDDGDEGYNLLFLFSAYPAEGGGGSTGAVTYVQGSMPSTAWNNRVADIATCRARGQVIMLSVGGAGRQVYMTSKARADAFIASIKVINEQLGGSGTTPAFDGIDWNNFELGGSDPEWMCYASLKLKAYYGSGFLISAPPAAFSLSVGQQGGDDRELLATLHLGGTQDGYSGTALDWFCPQFYDGLNQLTTVRNALNFYNTAISVPGSTENGTTTQSVQIPRSKIGIGFGMQTPTWTNSGYWTVPNAITAYETMVSEGLTPRGGFNWAVQIDPTHVFPINLGPIINPDAGGGATLTTIKVINGKLIAALQRINGILVAAIKSRNGRT
jgi:hypothetical protein